VRTRADENRVFVVVMAVDGSWQVIAPSGAPVAEGPRNRVDAVLVDLHLALYLGQGDGAHESSGPRTDATDVLELV
jgi:hypothetical protein